MATSSKKGNGYWNYERCYEEAKKYKSKAELKKNSTSAYQSARKNGWLEKYTWFINPNIKWDYNACYEEAKKYNSSIEFKTKNRSAYMVSCKNGWLEKYTWFINPSKKWSYERCYKEALMYKSRNEFKHSNQPAYQSARKNGWLDNYTWFEEKNKPNGYWNNYDNCYKEAQKYNSRTDFYHGSGLAYQTARKNGWLDSFTWFKSLTPMKEYKYNLLEEFISEYEFRTFLENNDQNILLIIIRNLEPKYEPIKKDLEKALARTKETDPIKALRDKYMSDDEEQDVNDETENTDEENVHDITTIDMDDDEAFKAVMTEITESSEESEEEDGEKEEKELSIDDVVKNDETELKVINKIEHMLTPEDRKYIMEKFLHDRRRQWMAEREKKSCNA